MATVKVMVVAVYAARVAENRPLYVSLHESKEQRLQKRQVQIQQQQQRMMMPQQPFMMNPAQMMYYQVCCPPPPQSLGRAGHIAFGGQPNEGEVFRLHRVPRARPWAWPLAGMARRTDP
jgi:hypothetical protein